MKRIWETIICGLLLLFITAPISYKAIAQAFPPVGIFGQTTPGNYQQFKTDANGLMYTTGISGTQSSPGVASPVQAITVSTVNSTAVAANTARTAICIQQASDNNTGVYFQFGGAITTTAGGMLISGIGNSYCQYTKVDTRAISMSGTASTTGIRVTEWN